MLGEGNDDYIVPGVSECDRSDDNGPMFVMVMGMMTTTAICFGDFSHKVC